MDSFRGRNRSGWIVLILVVLNLILLAAFWLTRYYSVSPTAEKSRIEKSKPVDISKGEPVDQSQQRKNIHIRRGEQLNRFLRSELNYSAEQVKGFMELREEHFQTVETLRREMDTSRRELMAKLMEKEPDMEEMIELSNQIGDLHSQLEIETFKHLQALKKFGNKEQQAKFEEILHEILFRMRPPQHGPPPGGQPPGPGGGREPHPGPMGHPPGEFGPPDRQGPPGRPDGQHFFRRLNRDLQLSDSLSNKIGTIISNTFQKINRLHDQPISHEERHIKIDGIFKQMDNEIMALLDDQQKRQYRFFVEERERRRPR